MLGAASELDDSSKGNSNVEQDKDSDSESTGSSEKEEGLPKVETVLIYTVNSV